MGLRERLLGWLGRGEVAPPAPDTPIEVAVVALHEGPMLVARFRAAGIAAHGYEASSVAQHGMAQDLYRILVPYADLEAAEQLLAEDG